MKSIRATLLAPILVFCIAQIAPPATEAGLTVSESSILKKYDHDLHERKVFGPLKIDCSNCHNFSQAPNGTGSITKFQANEELKASTFRKPVRQICHECHQGARAEFKDAPKACYTCHTTLENMKQIKPQNHSNVDWAHAHGSNARSNPASCGTCHSNSSCVKCHARRNDVFLVNHSRNFRFVHSIEARVQPQKCDTCHTKDYCIKCHLGRGR